MPDMDITLYYNQHRLNAMQKMLVQQDSNVEKALYRFLDEFYLEIIPEQERGEIENRIAAEKQQEQAAMEASRRFSVVHLHDGETDYHFTSELHTSFLQAARLYRVVTKDLKSPLPCVESMPHAFRSHQSITPQQFSDLCDSIATDNRITAIMEFNFEDGTVGVCQSSDNAWWYYDLKDVSAAVYRADRKSNLRPGAREEIFSAALEGKELDVYGEAISEEDGQNHIAQDEDCSPVISM